MSRSRQPKSLISWNVNGLRAVLQKGFEAFVRESSPDVLCLQEIKALPDQIEDLSWSEGYDSYWNPAEKKGYSGTLVLTKVPPLSTALGMGMTEHDQEGRVITLEFSKHFLVNVYTPNSQNQLRRLPYRRDWNRDFLAYLKSLEKSKPVVVCGDLNVAHTEIDLANPKTNRKNAGFTEEEREDFTTLLESGFVDTFRMFTPDPHHYTWWSYRAGARSRNIGWRIDYWLVSEALRKKVKASEILPEVMGSDHCPVQLTLS